MIQAVIFDMDGVISDTLLLHTRADSKILASYGIHMTPEEIIAQFNGVTDPEMYESIFKKDDTRLNHKKIAEEKIRTFKELSKQGIIAIPGSIDLIQRLSKKFPLGLGSSTPGTLIDIILSTLNVKQKFQAITSPEEVKYGKPNPEMYLLTAKKLGVKPEDCVVIEDARGIKAARSAGMKVVAITTTHQKDELQDATIIIDSFKELTVEKIKNL